VGFEPFRRRAERRADSCHGQTLATGLARGRRPRL